MSANRQEINPAVFTPEQWDAVNAFAEAQARANFEYQQQLPTQRVVNEIDTAANFLYALFAWSMGLFGLCFLGATIGWHASGRTTAGMWVGVIVGAVAWLLCVAERLSHGRLSIEVARWLHG